MNHYSFLENTLEQSVGSYHSSNCQKCSIGQMTSIQGLDVQKWQIYMISYFFFTIFNYFNFYSITGQTCFITIRKDALLIKGYDADRQRFCQNLQTLYIGNLLRNKGILDLQILFNATPIIALDLMLDASVQQMTKQFENLNTIQKSQTHWLQITPILSQLPSQLIQMAQNYGITFFKTLILSIAPIFHKALAVTHTKRTKNAKSINCQLLNPRNYSRSAQVS